MDDRRPSVAATAVSQTDAKLAAAGAALTAAETMRRPVDAGNAEQQVATGVDDIDSLMDDLSFLDDDGGGGGGGGNPGIVSARVADSSAALKSGEKMMKGRAGLGTIGEDGSAAAMAGGGMSSDNGTSDESDAAGLLDDLAFLDGPVQPAGGGSAAARSQGAGAGGWSRERRPSMVERLRERHEAAAMDAAGPAGDSVAARRNAVATSSADSTVETTNADEGSAGRQRRPSMVETLRERHIAAAAGASVDVSSVSDVSSQQPRSRSSVENFVQGKKLAQRRESVVETLRARRVSVQGQQSQEVGGDGGGGAPQLLAVLALRSPLLPETGVSKPFFGTVLQTKLSLELSRAARD